MLRITVSVTGSAGDGIERSGAPWGPRNGGWLCCQSQLSKSIPSPAPSDGTANNLPSAFPSPYSSILSKERCHWCPGDAGGCPSPVHESRGTLSPKLEPLSHPELSIEGCREQVSKATDVNNSSPQVLGFPNPPDLGVCLWSPTLGLCLQRAPITWKYTQPCWMPKGCSKIQHHQLYITVTAL